MLNTCLFRIGCVTILLYEGDFCRLDISGYREYFIISVFTTFIKDEQSKINIGKITYLLL
ncbi:hypothetical protein BH10BAC2_BH10BAC2_43680 [soil metagenome]